MTSLAAVDHALNSGDLSRGLELLRAHCSKNAADASSWHRLAVLEEKNGKPENANLAHLQCLKAAPNTAFGYFAAGDWLRRIAKPEAAAAAFSVVQDLQPALLEEPPVDYVDQSKAANRLLRATLSNQHRAVNSGRHASSRIPDAVWCQTHDQNFSYPEDNYAPQLFYVPELPRQKFYSQANFRWSEQLLARTPIINAELENAMTRQTSQNTIRPYLEAGMTNLGNLQSLAGSSSWSALDLYRGGQINQDLLALFPKTLSALEEVPTYNLASTPFEVFFSILKGKQNIAPHFGESNHALTAHLPLIIPGSGHLEVGGETREWQQGEMLLFDDSYLHSAHNQSNDSRVVLIFSIWHPDLSEEERSLIRRSFQAREAWYARRGETIQQALSG